MIVVVIIGVLAAIAVPNFVAMQTRAREGSIKQNMHVLQTAVEDFNVRGAYLYPSNFSETIVEANPYCAGSDANASISMGLYFPTNDTYGPTAILPGNVRNPFARGNYAVHDGNDTNMGLANYTYNAALNIYQIRGIGARGVLDLILTPGEFR